MFNFAAGVSLVLLLGTVGLWAYSEWHFTRISFTYGLPSKLQDRRLTFLAWSNAVELMIQKEGLQPDQGCTQEQLRQEVKHMAYTKVYQQEELSTDEPDVQMFWAFHYRSPQDAQAINLSYSTPGVMGGVYYLSSIRHERAFFISWWLLTGLLAVLPALVARKWLQKRSRLLQGLCTCCGYNLAGNVSGVCPECGAPAQAKGREIRT